MSFFALSQQSAARLRAGVPDIRGFEVRTRADGDRAGRVADVVVDESGQPHFVDVDLGGLLGGLLSTKRVLLPATRVQVDAGERVAWVMGMSRDELKALPAHDGDVRRIAGGTTGGAAVAAAEVADRDAVRLTLAEEELSVGRRAVPAGEVGVRKLVETRRVQQSVPVMREEVTVERRAVTGVDAATARVEVTEDEVRIPIFSEEVVVEKRVVPREEYIVRKRTVTETRTVEEDLRRERLEVDRSGSAGPAIDDLTAAADVRGGGQPRG
jgi:uncharacterized protein (TIGR02271 family)